VGGIAIAILVAYGVLPLSVVLYGGLIGGMLLMHVGGHGGHGGQGGHGGHGGHGGEGDQSDPEGGAPKPAEDLRRSSAGVSPDRIGFDTAADRPSTKEPNGSETHGHDERGSHGCH
jgi:hypothetical protein